MVNSATTPNDKSVRRQISFIAIADLIPAPHNARKHSRAQVRAIARSIEAFGFNAPVLIDKNRQIVAGHGHYEASKLLELTQVPVIFLDHLSEAQAKAPDLQLVIPDEEIAIDDRTAEFVPNSRLNRN